MKRRYIRRFACLSAAMFVICGAEAMGEEKTPETKGAASVNGIIISNQEVNRQLFVLEQHFLSTQGKAIRPDMVPGLRSKVVDELIDKELLFQESRKRGLEIEDQAVDEKMDVLKKQFPNEETFRDEMSQMDITEEALRLQIKKDMTVQQLVEKDILAKVKVSDEDARSFYDSHPEFFKETEKVRASHILVQSQADTDPITKDQRRKGLEAVRNRVEAGEDFASLAKEFSHCPSAEKGGDLGYFERGQMVKPFEEAAFSMKLGEVSDIVVTPFGFHLIKLTDRRPARTIPYDESKERIKQHLQRLKFTEEKNTYLGELKKKSKVEKY